MKAGIDFDLLRQYVDIPPAAETLLSKPEKEIHFSLNLKYAPETIIEADCYVVYHNTARGPAKGEREWASSTTLYRPSSVRSSASGWTPFARKAS